MNQQAAGTDKADDHTITEFLKENPDFLIRNPELLEILEVPHDCVGASSLIERQVRLLRAENHKLERRLQQLMQVARENDRLSGRVHRLALALLQPTGARDLLDQVQLCLRDEFNAESAVMRISTDRPVADQAEMVPDDDGDFSLFEDFLSAGRPLCGRLPGAQRDYLFGGQSDYIASAALIPLQGDNWRGLLAVGSTERERFQPGMGTLFLDRMGDLISTAISRCLDRESAGAN